MVLVDLPVGAFRALGEVGQLANEAREATSAATAAAGNASLARARLAKVANPSRQLDPVSRRMRRVAAFERAANEQARAAQAAHDRIRVTGLKDLGIVPGATLGGTGLFIASPPDALLSAEQREQDEKSRERLLAPAEGMPADVRMEMRVSAHQKVDTN